MSHRKEPKLRTLIFLRGVSMVVWFAITIASLLVAQPKTILILLLVSFGWFGWCLATSIAFSLLGRLIIQNESRTREEQLVELDYTVNRVLLVWFTLGIILLSIYLVNHHYVHLV